MLDFTHGLSSRFVALALLACVGSLGRAQSKLTAADGDLGDWFGWSVSIDGNRIAVGAPNEDGLGLSSGAAYVFDATTGQQLQKCTAPDGEYGDIFGESIALHGDCLVVGAWGDDVFGRDSGSAYVFDLTTGGVLHKLVPSDGASSDYFGATVGIDATGIVVGAFSDDDKGTDAGAAYVFDRATGQQLLKLTAVDGKTFDYFSSGGVAIGEGRIAVGSSSDGLAERSGAVYVFDSVSGQQIHKLVALDGSMYDGLGYGPTIGGPFVAAGAVGDDDVADNAGSVYVFDLTSGQQVKKLLAPDVAAGAVFGVSNEIDGTRIVVGAAYDDDAGQSSGSAYVFDLATGQQLAKLKAPDGAAHDQFGHSVGSNAGRVVSGSLGGDGVVPGSGCAYVFPEAGAPFVVSISGMTAQVAGGVVIAGQLLDSVTQVTVAGSPVVISSVASTSVTIAVGQAMPGFDDVDMTHSLGVIHISDGLERWPSVQAADSGVGGAVSVQLDNGAAGLYVLGYAVGLLPSPITISSPPTWSGLWLDVTGPFFVIGTGAFPTPAAVQLSYAVPNDPFLTGLVIHIQGWCQQGFFGPDVTYSFTNVARVTI